MKETLEIKKEIVNILIKNGVLLSSELIESLTNEDLEKFKKLLEQDKLKDIIVINKDFEKIISAVKSADINWIDLDKNKTLLEKGINKENYEKNLKAVSLIKPQKEEPTKKVAEKNPVKIVYNHKISSKKRDIQDFVKYFNKRYDGVKRILLNRTELKNMMSISRIRSKKDRESVSLIGLVKEKRITKNKNIILTIEDPTGEINVLVNQNRKDLFKIAENITLDEVIGITGTNAEKIVFSDNVLLPDIPTNKEFKKGPEEKYALFLSDIHVGSNNFLEEDFNKFLKWINCEVGNESQKTVASKVAYVFIAGDLIDGCGIYPGQEEELTIKDVKAQYSECARLLKKIPEEIKIIIIPGNHDAMRIAEPQPQLNEEYAKEIYEMPNTIILSNPSMVNIESSEDFPGFDILLYHGYSFDFFISEIDSIRNNGGYDRGDLVMKYLLQKRHLAPTHTSTLYSPRTDKDPLIIEKIPDFFLSGHIHKSVVANYRNITMVCGSCWQAKTPFQEKVGHNPEPGRVPIVNLKTREMKILKFSKS